MEPHEKDRIQPRLSAGIRPAWPRKEPASTTNDKQIAQCPQNAERREMRHEAITRVPVNTGP